MLSPRDRAVLDALLPPGGPGGLPGILETDFEVFEARWRGEAPAPMVLGWRAALFVAGWLSPLLIGRLPPFERLSAEDRAASLEALGKSRFYLLRQIMLLLKAVTGFGYGVDPRVRRAIGYPA